MLPRRRSAELSLPRQAPVDDATRATAEGIVAAVRREGEPALRRFAEQFKDIEPGGPLWVDADACRAALDSIDPADRRALESAAERVSGFAAAQRAAILDVELPVPGGCVGHRVVPVERAGCYAPGGRFPLPSSVLMTACTARAAGVAEVIVASPRPAPATLAAAAIAGADRVLAAGGAQAVAALAYGVEHAPACDAVVGPGNRFVTAAKRIVSGDVAIDMLAGPSEVLVIADASSDPAVIAADLLAQCEHDPDASAVLLSIADEGLLGSVDRELAHQLAALPEPNRATASAALKSSAGVVVADLDEAVAVSDAVAPEHLQIITQDAASVAARVSRYGGLFIGAGAAEVVGDYGVGPNHTLPTGGTARFTSGLSVLCFLRMPTFVRLDQAPASLYEQTARLARLEGLEAHARAAEQRMT